MTPLFPMVRRCQRHVVDRGAPLSMENFWDAIEWTIATQRPCCSERKGQQERGARADKKRSEKLTPRAAIRPLMMQRSIQVNRQIADALVPCDCAWSIFLLTPTCRSTQNASAPFSFFSMQDRDHTFVRHRSGIKVASVRIEAGS
jgi:hypothetical protein